MHRVRLRGELSQYCSCSPAGVARSAATSFLNALVVPALSPALRCCTPFPAGKARTLRKSRGEAATNQNSSSGSIYRLARVHHFISSLDFEFCLNLSKQYHMRYPMLAQTAVHRMLTAHDSCLCTTYLSRLAWQHQTQRTWNTSMSIIVHQQEYRKQLSEGD